MGGKSSKQPAAPDPTMLANAQATANQQTALQNQKLNMVGSQDQYGSVSWVADPSQPGGYRQVTSLSPQEQASYDLSKQAENGALNTATQQIGRVNQALGQGFDLNRLPGLYQGGVQTQVGGDLEAARMQAQDAAYQQATSRLDPQFQTAQSQLETKLANQGLSANSAAFQNRQDQFGRDKNDAYSMAQRNAVDQGNTAANELFARQLGQGQFANSAQDQAFGQSLTGRQNAAQEMAYAQNLPIQQLQALLGTGSVGAPTAIGYTPSQAAGTDVLGAYGLNLQQQNANAQRKQQQQSGLMNGLFSLGSAAIMASDERLKEDIVRIGRRADGLGVYRFRYRGDPEQRVGFIAQEVRRTRPDAVFRRPDGMLAVNLAVL